MGAKIHVFLQTLRIIQNFDASFAFIISVMDNGHPPESPPPLPVTLFLWIYFTWFVSKRLKYQKSIKERLSVLKSVKLSFFKSAKLISIFARFPQINLIFNVPMNWGKIAKICLTKNQNQRVAAQVQNPKLMN